MSRKRNTYGHPMTLPSMEQFGVPKTPSTRYQGSKAKLVSWIWEHVKELEFSNALDLFGGTGVVGYFLKREGKQVYYNDYLKSNYYAGVALIENNTTTLSTEDIANILAKDNGYDNQSFIAKTFKDIYYTDEENAWLDVVVQNIQGITDIYKKGLAYYVLFQACLVKRPFNLFHRKNLYLRFADVKRSFGNKATWDRPFEDHFFDFVQEVNDLVSDNGKRNKAYNKDVFEIEGDYDLVYVDPPYTSSKGITVDYLNFYHFLEGMVNYDAWTYMIDYRTKNRRFHRRHNIWNDKKMIRSAFRQLFEKFKNSILVISYRSDGIPSIEELRRDLKAVKKRVSIYTSGNYKYVLSNSRTSEVLLVGE